MFKKWYNGVNNYVLDLEQLQRRWSGTPQQKGPPFAVAAPLPQPIPGGSIRNDVDRQRLNRRQVCKELYPSCTTKVAYAFLPRRIHLICLSLPLAGAPSAGEARRRTSRRLRICAGILPILCHASNDGGVARVNARRGRCGPCAVAPLRSGALATAREIRAILRRRGPPAHRAQAFHKQQRDWSARALRDISAPHLSTGRRV
jgi:hypothetical protein